MYALSNVSMFAKNKIEYQEFVTNLNKPDQSVETNLINFLYHNN